MAMNMSYCRMENTLMALDECFSAIENRENLSHHEAIKFRQMVIKMYDFLSDNCLIDDEGILLEDEVDSLIRECQESD